MKNLRKLIPALAMLVLSAVLMSTASFAWFSMQTTVTAGTMKVTANTKSASLVISDSSDLSSATESVTLSTDVKSLKPVKPMDSVTASTYGTVTSWGTAISTSAGDPASNAQIQALDSGASFGEYIYTDTVYVGYASGSAETGGSLYATITITKTDGTATDLGPISVILVVDDTTVVETVTGTGENNGKQISTAIGTVPVTGSLAIDIYVYYDGSHASVYSNNAGNLANASVDFSFSTVKDTSES